MSIRFWHRQCLKLNNLDFPSLNLATLSSQNVQKELDQEQKKHAEDVQRVEALQQEQERLKALADELQSSVQGLRTEKEGLSQQVRCLPVIWQRRCQIRLHPRGKVRRLPFTSLTTVMAGTVDGSGHYGSDSR